MSERLQAIRGMNDMLPDETVAWQRLEKMFRECVARYGYREIRFPIVENTALFRRSIGDVTDIVEKEMYTFADMNGDSLTLRPEGTAGCVRACLEHGLLYNQQQRLWYAGPMFRHERPQKGRYRQFHQFGVEALGIPGAGIELEMLQMTRNLWIDLGIHESVTLEINTLGSLQERQVYRETLVTWLEARRHMLDEDSQRRLTRNPLRILDSKNPAIRDLLSDAPRLMDVLGDESRTHFETVCTGLDSLGIGYRINPNLVRGLDYYGQTVFEWVTDKLGSQDTVCAGGRYDILVEQLGGTPTSAAGFAMGMERLLLLISSVGKAIHPDCAPWLYVIAEADNRFPEALKLADRLRECTGKAVILNMGGGSFKSQFKRADKSGARFAVIYGEEERASECVGLKDLREGGEQQRIPLAELVSWFRKLQ